MQKDYSFLKDELALAEIRKHKWLESEKEGYEIGFATAALDWVKKYGAMWLQFRLASKNPENIFAEKRSHRRFYQKFPVELEFDNAHILCHSDDINLIGLSCTVPANIPDNSQTKVTIRFTQKDGFSSKTRLEFASRITRVSKPQNPRVSSDYQIFLPFSEEVRDYLRSHAEVFNN